MKVLQRTNGNSALKVALASALLFAAWGPNVLAEEAGSFAVETVAEGFEHLWGWPFCPAMAVCSSASALAT